MELARLCLVPLTVLSLLIATAYPLAAQSTVRLPLPVDSPANALAFEAEGPTAAVLTGVLLPASGPLTAWAAVWSSLQADGSLKEAQTGGWTGPRPEKWLKVVKPGYVVAGFRSLLRVGAGGVQTRQVQIFWKPWSDGSVQGEVLTSRVYGQAAAAADEVKIIEIRLPSGAVPTTLYGQTVSGSVSQVSLVVRQGPAPQAKAPEVPLARQKGPVEPTVPPVVLAKP